jgi:hypothetical protein
MIVSLGPARLADGKDAIITNAAVPSKTAAALRELRREVMVLIVSLKRRRPLGRNVVISRARASGAFHPTQTLFSTTIDF